MKVLFGLCLIAVVLCVGEASRTYRRAAEECIPDQCLVKDGKMCKCGEDGTVENAKCIDKIPPMSILGLLAQFTDELSCTCTPGEEFRPDGYVCTCPESGVLTPPNCVPVPKRAASRRRSNQIRSKTYRSIGLYQECQPGSCVVHNGKLCVCGEDGQPDANNCFPSDVLPPMRRDGFCTCTPDDVFDIDTHTCVCPAEGELDPEIHCTTKKRRFG